MLKKIYFFVFILLFQFAYGTLKRMTYEYSGIVYEKITRQLIRDNLDISLFQEPYDCTGYAIADTSFSFYTDAMWHRIIYAWAVEPDSEIKWVESYGTWGSDIGQFTSPHGIAIDSQYFMYVADSDNRRVVKLKLQYDTLMLHYIEWIDEIGEGILQCPWDVAIEGNKLYVTDAKLHKVFRFSLSGNYEVSFGGYGITVGKFNTPKGIAICDSFIYISDTDNQRVVALKDKGSYIEFLRWLYPDLQENNYILDIEVDQRGVIYACDVARSKILKFSPELISHCYSFGAYGTGVNQFRHPKGMFIQDTAIVIIEEWTDNSGIQAYKEVVKIKEFKISKDSFDATEQNITVNFTIDDFSAGAELTIEDRVWNFTDLNPNEEYQIVWDGRHNNDSLFLPGDYLINLSLIEGDAKHITVTVKGTEVAGILTQDEHWIEEGEPYVLTSDVQLYNNKNLTIDPGVKVMPTGDFVLQPYLIHCNSSIFARGSAINKILFTPHRKLLPEPDSVSKGFWKGIYYRGNTAEEDSLILEHCIIEYAGSSTAAVHIEQNTSPAIITNTEISNSGSFGLYDYYYSNVTIDNCVFEDNDSMPILTGFKAIGNISNNTFMNNQPDAIGLLSVPLQEDATAHNQGVPFWLLYADFGRSFQIWKSNSLATLTIEPGTVIQCDDEVYFWVGQPSTTNRGRIVTQGDELNPITFTAIDTTKPWLGIQLNSYNPQDTSIFEYCELSHGWKPNTYSLYADGMIGLYCAHTPFVLKNSTLSRSRGCGINYDGTSGDLSIIPEIRDNQFIANDSFPIIMPANYLRNMEGNTFIDNGYNEIWVNPERINQSLTWHNQGIPYIIAGQIQIQGNGDTVVTVEIESGSNLKFKQGNCVLHVYDDDRLIARSARLTTADATSCNRMLIFDNADSSLVDSCLIENQWSMYDDYGAIDVTGSIVTVTNSVITNNRTGLTIRSNSNVEMSNNQIVLNEHGVWVHNIPEAVVINHNDFFGNKCALSSAHSGGYPYTVADSNWWGHASGPWDPSEGPPDYNPAGLGDSIGDYVLYRPWLESPVHPEVIFLIQPNGGETLYSGDICEIQWSRTVTPVKQELYYTTDYPEGGMRSETLWIFIDTVATGQTQYLWQVPGTASERCRVAVKVYYEMEETGDKETWGYKKTEVMKLRGYKDEITRNDKQEGLSNGHKSRTTNTMIAVDISDANFSIILNEYTLSIFTNGAGSVTKNPDLPLYPHGTSVVLTANPASENPLDPEPEWIFDAWSGDLESSENPDTLIMDSDKSVIATFSYVLNLDSFPMYQAESLPGYHEMCGPANGQMTLNYMWWNRMTYPDSAPMVFDNQAVLYDTGIAHNATPGLDFFDLNGMWYVVQHYKPNPYTQYGYNFTKRQNTDSTVLLKQICQWIDYCVGELSGGHEPGHPLHVPGIIPAYGNYTNWMAVRGFRTDTIAYPMPDTLEVYGFWMNDPYPEALGGIGENSYKTVTQFLSDYYDPLSTGDQWQGKYVAICEPPEQGDGCVLILAQPTPQFTDEQIHQVKLVSNQYDIPLEIKGWIIQAAINGVYEHLIPYDEHFKAVFQITTPGDPFLVKGIDNNDYYTVPFNFNFPMVGDFIQKKSVAGSIPQTKSKFVERTGLSEAIKNLNEVLLPAVEPTLIVILIDAQDGHFKEASWTQTPVKYLPITKQEAQNMLSEVLEELGIEVPILNKLSPELIHRNSSPYYPEWKFVVGEYAIYIGQDGSVSVEMPDDDTRGDGGVMSDRETYVYSLATAVPTPFTKSTTISYSIAQPDHVSLKVYDISGRLVRILADERKNAGVYSIVWNGYDQNNNEVAPGIYFTECTSRDFTSVKKIIFVK